MATDDTESLQWKHAAITVTGRTVSLRQRVKDTEGRPLCRWCGGLVKRPRISWCDDECVKEYKAAIALMSSEGQREYLMKLESGVCRVCGVDAERLLGRMQRAYELLMHWSGVPQQGRNTPPYRHIRGQAMFLIGRAVKRRIGRDPGKKLNLDRSWWEADHVVPLVEGGAHTMDNLRTLCIWCHRDATKALAGRRAQERKKPPTR